MQKGQYVLHARQGKLTKVPAEKTLLPHDPKGHHQSIDIAIGPDGTV
jgi:glucose/arabinose dehydrogenase